MSIEIAIIREWASEQGAQFAPGLNPDSVAVALWNTRNRIAEALAHSNNLAGDQFEAFVVAVVNAPPHINNGNGTMSPIDWNAIGMAAAEECNR